MSEKHYNAGYLEDTARIMKNLKEHSYQPFQHIASGTIADLGCGTGIDVINMAQLLGDNLKVVGIDHDPVMIDKARTAAAQVTNAAFQLGEVSPLPFTGEALSGVRAERLFQHLSNSETVIGEIKRVMQPGAPLVIVETDWNSLSFYNGDPAIDKKLNRYLTEEKVKNGFAAKKLTGYLEQGSFSDIKLEVFPFVLRSLKEAFDYLWINIMIQEMAEKNYISVLEKETFMSALQSADANQHFACSINIVVVSCVK